MLCVQTIDYTVCGAHVWILEIHKPPIPLKQEEMRSDGEIMAVRVKGMVWCISNRLELQLMITFITD